MVDILRVILELISQKPRDYLAHSASSYKENIPSTTPIVWSCREGSEIFYILLTNPPGSSALLAKIWTLRSTAGGI